MSVRYGLSLVLEPSYTAVLHRARQVICSQYGCWAAEMHSVHLPLTGYFPCPEEAAPAIDTGLKKLAREFRHSYGRTFMARRVKVVQAESEGSIYAEFADSPNPQAVDLLRQGTAAIFNQCDVASGEVGSLLRFPLLQYAPLPPRVFESAARFAEGVVNGLELAPHAGLAELAFFRYESVAAGEDWDKGGWAADLNWQIIGIYPLTSSD